MNYKKNQKRSYAQHHNGRMGRFEKEIGFVDRHKMRLTREERSEYLAIALNFVLLPRLHISEYRRIGELKVLCQAKLTQEAPPCETR